MALCPVVAPPPIDPDGAVDGLVEFDHKINVNPIILTVGDDKSHPGDYTIAGVGARNSATGTAIIKLKTIPPGTEIVKAWLIYNTYQSNNQPDPPAVTLNGVGGGAALYGLCGSTCWYNPGFEATTYLSNRVYYKEVTAIVKGNGNYTVGGLPVTPAMRIGTDGDRIPGCQCNQGAILYVVWKWKDDQGPINAIPAAPNSIGTRFRGIRAYIGAILLSNNPTFGATPSYNLSFMPVFDEDDPPNKTYYKGNAHIMTAAGDTQTSIPGDSFAVNQVRFIPPNNAFTKISPSLSVRDYRVAQIYDGENSAFAKTTNDCICWFFFVVSGDKTQPKSQFQIVNCVATWLIRDATPEDTTILVSSNFTQTSQTVSGPPPAGQCRAAKYTGRFVEPNPPGMFPAAPYYIKIDNEIMKVTAKAGNQKVGIETPDAEGQLDQLEWTVVRGQAGTTAAFHAKPSDPITGEIKTCVYMLAPPKSISDMHAALAARGQAKQKPESGRPAGGQ